MFSADKNACSRRPRLPRRGERVAAHLEGAPLPAPPRSNCARTPLPPHTARDTAATFLPLSPQDSEWHRVGSAVEVNVKALKKVGEKAPQSTKQSWQPATNTKGAASWANAKVEEAPVEAKKEEVKL